MATGDVMGFAQYLSDNGVTYAVKISQVTATQGNFSGFSVNPLPLPAWPWNKKDLRHVTGKSGSGKTARLSISTPDTSLYTTGGSFIIDAGTFTVQGAEGERRPKSHLR